MSNRVKVSVLVPIYNVEKFLPECLDSLVGQTLKDIEIICINDGSTDNSLEIIKDYAKKDKRIVIIDKKNSGYGDSMNQGLKKATGEYVGIVESDDFIDVEAFKTMYEIAKQHDVEVVKSNFYEYFGEKGKDVATSDLFLPDEIDRIIDPREHHNIFYQPPCIWAAIYKNSFLEKNNIDFLPTPGAAYQDTGFSFKVWAMARKVYFIKRAFLHYRQDNANSSVKDSGKIYCVKEEHDAIEKYLTEKGLLNELGPIAFTCRFGSYVWNLHRLKFGAAMEFSKVVTKDYRRAKKMGMLDSSKLDWIGQHNKRLLAIRHPKLYIIFRPLHDLRNRVRPFFSKLVKIFFPRYRQRIRTIDSLARLKEAQDELYMKVEEMEMKKENNESKS